MEAVEKEYGEEAMNKDETNFAKIVRPKILQLFTHLVKSMCLPVDEKKSLHPYEQGRAIYGVDIMFNFPNGTYRNSSEVDGMQNFNLNDIEPSLIEVTYMPDLSNPIDQFPGFIDDVLSTLILDKPPESVTKLF